MTWVVEHTLIDEGVPVARDAWHLRNLETGEIMEDSTTEDYDSAEFAAFAWNEAEAT